MLRFDLIHLQWNKCMA